MTDDADHTCRWQDRFVGRVHAGVPEHPLIIELVEDCRGETVVLGQSSIPGVWSCHAVARLAGGYGQGGHYHVLLENRISFAESISIVAQGDIHAGAIGRPYDVDVLDDRDASRILHIRILTP